MWLSVQFYAEQKSYIQEVIMLMPTTSMIVVFVLICFIFPCILYIKKRKDFINIIEDTLAEEELRQKGYHHLVLKKYRCNIYALRPGARSREEVSLNARHQKSTNIWNMIEYNLTVYGQKKGRHVEVFQCDWTEERQQELVRFVERFNFATLPAST